jgi:hypothetical protein
MEPALCHRTVAPEIIGSSPMGTKLRRAPRFMRHGRAWPGHQSPHMPRQMAGSSPIGANLGASTPIRASWPGLTRSSIAAPASTDGRVKPGHDDKSGCRDPKLAPMGSGPAMTV